MSQSACVSSGRYDWRGEWMSEAPERIAALTPLQRHSHPFTELSGAAELRRGVTIAGSCPRVSGRKGQRSAARRGGPGQPLFSELRGSAADQKEAQEQRTRTKNKVDH